MYRNKRETYWKQYEKRTETNKEIKREQQTKKKLGTEDTTENITNWKCVRRNMKQNQKSTSY